jgi:hypothetical protein
MIWTGRFGRSSEKSRRQTPTRADRPGHDLGFSVQDLEISVSDSPATNAERAPAKCRSFRLSDAMILIAGLAIVFAMGGHLLKFFVESCVQICRAIVANMASIQEDWAQFPRLIREPSRQAVSYGLQFSAALVSSMTLIFFILRLRRPRPPWRVLVVQPGVAAGLAMVFGLFWVTGLVHIVLPDSIDSFGGPWIVIGATVATAWIVLALFRKWKPEPGWVDRLGRALSVMAIGTALLGWVMYRI